MDNILKLQKKVLPEMIDLLEKRYKILRNIYYNQPIGRRGLANNLEMGERIVRTEVNLLKKQGLIDIKSMGMNVTEEGKKIIDQLKDFIHNLKDIAGLEEALKVKLRVRNVIVAPGDIDTEELIFKDVCRTGANHLSKLIKRNHDNECIIGVTGGTTMAELAEEMKESKKDKDLLVIPVRGGIGKNLETQSNNIAAKLAGKLNGAYKLLHVPDNIGKEALETLLQIDEIKELNNLTKKIDILVFGIGRADDMARRRKLNKDTLNYLEENEAVAEAFGYYFDINGEIKMESNTFGLGLEDFKKIPSIIGVACGTKKAESIIAISTLREDMTIVTDEGTARKILEI
ncbi:sugar-binding domain-containing protein [Clostridiaceae bacterium M8S5]|nr:sugar-binding domain-containing protein [Clostridiaceae bacterium M8S5]